MLDSKKFKKNIENYNSNAIVQKNIAKELVKLLTLNANKNFDRIFEIGCGSGFLTEEIFKNLKYNSLILNDIIESSKNYVENFSSNFICGNIEEIDFPSNTNLIISSSVFQWLNSFEKFILKVHKSLDANGIFAFSMFIDENFAEIKNFFNIGLNYLTNDEIIKILQKNFEIIFCSEKENIFNFKAPIEIFRHIKNTGVNVINNEKLTKNKVCDFIGSDVFSLTYKYNFVIARKK